MPIARVGGVVVVVDVVVGAGIDVVVDVEVGIVVLDVVEVDVVVEVVGGAALQLPVPLSQPYVHELHDTVA